MYMEHGATMLIVILKPLHCVDLWSVAADGLYRAAILVANKNGRAASSATANRKFPTCGVPRLLPHVGSFTAVGPSGY